MHLVDLLYIIMFTIYFFENRAVYDNVEKYCGEGRATDVNMAHAHCMLDNYGYKHAQYAIFIGLPHQQWLHERASVLPYTCISCLVIILTHV